MNGNGRQTAGRAEVVLVSMPWTTLAEPSLGLGILKSVLEREGIPCRVRHLNLFLLEHLKVYTYDSISRVFALNDFVFSGVLDPEVTNKQLRTLRPQIEKLLHEGAIDTNQYGGADGVLRQILHLRQEIIPQWIEKYAQEIAASEATLVGFTCMFDQTIASVALAKRIRELAPSKLLALGGYAVRSPTAQMLLKAFPWIDAVCDGEGERTIVQLARASTGEIPLLSVQGIVLRPAGSSMPFETPAPPEVDLDTNPAPNFDDFFCDIKHLSSDYSVDITPIDLPIENSRGCWWGAKHHCTFCGIKDADMAYRARSHTKVLDEMKSLSEKHNLTFFHFTDYILAHQYYETLLPELVRIGSPYSLSAEMKANISPERFELMAAAGFEEVQPGIESFSSDALRRMDKGVTSVQNIENLLCGRRLGVRVYYNLIFGFPTDDLESYRRMVRQLPRLFHLSPPVTCIPVQITRYAPMQTNPSRFGIPEARPHPTYDLIFSEAYLRSSGFSIEDYCYYFERPYEQSPRLETVYDDIILSVDQWRKYSSKDEAWLYAESVDEFGNLTIRDRRGPEEEVLSLSECEAKVLSGCRRPVSLETLTESLGPKLDVARIIERLDELKLIYRDEDKVISLVLPKRPERTAFALRGTG